MLRVGADVGIFVSFFNARAGDLCCFEQHSKWDYIVSHWLANFDSIEYTVTIHRTSSEHE